MTLISELIASELSVGISQVEAAARLLLEGNTVPFISRYRKEVTGGLDDTQLRTLETRLAYLTELEERKKTVLDSISSQGKLTAELERDIRDADTKSRLEDLYLPYKPKRRTKGKIAEEAGLSPLARSLLENPMLDPASEAAKYVDPEKGLADVEAALEGAKYILLEQFAEDADLAGQLREKALKEGLLVSRVTEGKETEGAKYRDYFDHSEPLGKVPSHRALAMLRGFREGVLHVGMEIGEESRDRAVFGTAESMIAARFGISVKGRPADPWLAEVVRWTWRVKLLNRIQTDLLAGMREAAEEEAIRVFASNLKDLLLAAPAGHKAVIGLDPGLRTGVKVAVVDLTGKFVDHATIYPLEPWNKTGEAAKILYALAKKHGATLVAIGNGTGGRETDRFMAGFMAAAPELKLTRVIVNEAGASVYSASELAAEEFPDLDVTIRGAVSIARRLQDPLAELVKIDPKSIGVGQYQHDVNQTMLGRSLDAVVEDCVNAVGVDVNTASLELLNRVAGLNRAAARNIIAARNASGAFSDRMELKKVPMMGAKTFEQAAGFLRITNGTNPLDASAVHPESYEVVERIMAATGRDLGSLMGDGAFLKTLKPGQFADGRFGVPTVTDIIAELEKPGRDPRPEFKTANLREGVETITDLEPGMVLEGTITNVTNFGAFVDIGVHQDGLVHISALSDRFISDPRQVVKTGEIVKVKVIEIDVPRNRIALSMRMGDEPGAKKERGKDRSASPRDISKAEKSAPPRAGFASLFQKAGKMKR